jgi:ABC-type antimicrobial peptide transport system permease subunit
MSNALIYIGIVVGVAAMAGAIAYGTANQQNYISEDAVLSQAAKEGILQKTGNLGADLNKEQWHEDPFADEAAKVRAAFEAAQSGK